MKKLWFVWVGVLLFLTACQLGDLTEGDGVNAPSSTKALMQAQELAKAGLTNVNPDLNGDLWIVGGLRMPTAEETLATPQISLPVVPATKLIGLPSSVDLTKTKYFRPIFIQYGGSCAQASGVGYLYTYEMNALNNQDASDASNQYSVGYTWNAVNNANDQGSWFTTGWDVIKINGIPNVATYEGDTASGTQYRDFSRFMTGFEKYRAANQSSLESYSYIDTSSVSGWNTFKEWMVDHGNGSSTGGAAVFACNITGDVQYNVLSNQSTHSGQKVITAFGTSGGHGMTIAGYDDNVVWDYNGDGRYTTDEDINGDGIVDLRDCERGAFLVVNSWGSSWGNGGKIWAMAKLLAESSSQGGIWTSRVYVLTPKKVNPTITARVKLQYQSRKNLNIEVGYSLNTNASLPDQTKSFSKLFSYSGSVNMISDTNTDAIELSLDISRLMHGVDLSRDIKYFLKVTENDSDHQYSGKIEYFSVVDRSGDSQKEYTSPSANVVLSDGQTTILSVLNKEVKVSVYPQMQLRGTFNAWNQTSMTLVSNYIWQTKVTFNGQSDDRFKFDVNGDWSVNFGDNNADGVAEQSGKDIFTSGKAGNYTITLNDKTLEYTVEREPVLGKAALYFDGDSNALQAINGRSAQIFRNGVYYSYVGIHNDATHVNPYSTMLNLPEGNYTFSFDFKVGTNRYQSETNFTIDFFHTNINQNVAVNTIWDAYGILEVYFLGDDYYTLKQALLGEKVSAYQNGQFKGSGEFQPYGMYYFYAEITNLAYGSYDLNLDFTNVGSNGITTRFYASTNVILDRERVSPSIQIMREVWSNYSSVYDQVYLRGTANNWQTTPMKLVGNHQWQIEATFGTSGNERFKFDVNGDWSLNFGDNEADGIADQNGNDISVPNGTKATIIFNDLTKAYQVNVPTTFVEVIPSGVYPESELIQMPVRLLKNGSLVKEKSFVLDGSSYISAHFSDLPLGNYTLEMNVVTNGYSYTASTNISLTSENGSYLHLFINKQAVGVKTIHYYSTWSTAYLHYEKDNGSWTSVPGVQMSQESNGWYNTSVQDENELTFCFNNGSGLWDSSHGANYSTTASEVWVKDGQVFLSQPTL